MMSKFSESSLELRSGIRPRTQHTLSIEDEEGYEVADVKYEKKDDGVIMIDLIRVFGTKKRGGYGSRLLEELIRRTCTTRIVPDEDGFTDEGDEFMGSFAYRRRGVRYDGESLRVRADSELLEGCD